MRAERLLRCADRDRRFGSESGMHQPRNEPLAAAQRYLRLAAVGAELVCERRDLLRGRLSRQIDQGAGQLRMLVGDDAAEPPQRRLRNSWTLAIEHALSAC